MANAIGQYVSKQHNFLDTIHLNKESKEQKMGQHEFSQIKSWVVRSVLLLLYVNDTCHRLIYLE